MTKGYGYFVTFAVIGVFAACGSDDGAHDEPDSAVPDVTTTDTQADALDTNVPDAPDAPDIEVLAEARIGPAGGVVSGDGVRLIVPAGALASDTDIRLVMRDASEVPYRFSPLIGLEPEGLVFATPARVEFTLPTGVLGAQILWTHTDDENQFQLLPTTLTAQVASAPIVHFSSIYLGNPTIPPGPTNPTGWFCCEPKDPNTHTDADCISWSAGTGTTCDPSICDLTPGACPTDPPGVGCCAPGPTGDEPTQGCATLQTYGQCALGIGQGFCNWSASCSTATPGCCSAQTPGVDAAPIACALMPDHATCTAASACQWNASSACPVPPTPGAPPCAECTDPTYTNAPAFVTSAQAAWATYSPQTCTNLAASPVPAPSTAPGDPNYAVELGRFCAFDAVLTQNGCSAPATLSPQCPGIPTDCCGSPSGANPTGTTCAALKSYGDCTLTLGAGLCQWNPVCPGAPGCCAAIDPQHDLPGFGCAALPDFNECVNSLGYGYCQWQAAGNCQTPSPCTECTDPSMLNDPDFQSAQQTWLAINTSPTCTTLAASPVAAPTATPGTTAWKAELGPWCAYQQAANGLACTSPQPACPNLPTSCCFATDPQNDLAQPGGCGALVTQFDCEYQVGLHFCTWNPSCGLGTPTQCCVQIDPGIDEPIVGCAQMPDYGECVLSLGFGYCEWDPSAGCPLPSVASCPYCADPAYNTDPNVQSAYLQGFSAYFMAGCPLVLSSPVPGPTTPPQLDPNAATPWETQLGRFCGYEAAFAALQCTPSASAQPACPAPPPPSTCCSPLIPGIDPPTASCTSLSAYGDCTQGAGLGYCQWNAGPNCQVPTHDACTDCLDPQWVNDPDVSSAANLSYQAYIAGGCAAMAQAPVPAPTAPPVTTSDKTQLGRFCGFEAAFQAASCLPSTTFAPKCPALPTVPTCCASAGPGLNPPTGTCAATKTFAACTAAANAGICQWSASPACPTPANQACLDCADPAYYNQPGFGSAFTASYQAYLTNGCSFMASSPVPPPSAATGSALYTTQLGRYCGFKQAVTSGGCGASVPGSVCPLCPTVPALCPPPAPTCSACAALATAPGFAAAYNASLSSVAANCQQAQAAGPPAISAALGTAAYGPQAGAYCGYLTGMQQHCNSPGCGGGLGCADCIDPQYVSDPIYNAALHFGWTRYGAETCTDLATLAIPAPTQPAGTAAFKSQLGRYCAFQLALEENGCTSPASACAGLSTCTSNAVQCILPTPTCQDCVAPAMMSNPAWQAGFAQATANLGALSCGQAYATSPPAVYDGPASPYYPQQLGLWCGYQDQLYQKCGGQFSQCNVP